MDALDSIIQVTLQLFYVYYFNYEIFIAGDRSMKICSQNSACVEFTNNLFVDEASQIIKSCSCLHPCNEIIYTTKIVKEYLPANASGDQMYRESLVIDFGDEEYVALRRSASFGAVSLLSNIGGFLGLFLGISLFSIVEVVYFFTIRLVNSLFLTAQPTQT